MTLLILLTVGLFFAFHFDMERIGGFLIVCLVGFIIFSMFVSLLDAVFEVVIILFILWILSFAVNDYNYSDDASDIDSDNLDSDRHNGYENPCIGTTPDKNGNERKLYGFKYYSGNDRPKYYRDDDGNIHYVN